MTRLTAVASVTGAGQASRARGQALGVGRRSPWAEGLPPQKSLGSAPKAFHGFSGIISLPKAD